MKITWTPRAKTDFNKILEYLHENWSLKEVNNFIDQTDLVIKDITANPKMFIESRTKKNVHKGFISKHNSLFYQVKPRMKEIVLLTFWDNRKDPKKRPF